MIVLFGFHGAGKTTTSLSLAKQYAESGYSVCVLPTDFYKNFSQFSVLSQYENIDIIYDYRRFSRSYSMQFKRFLDLVDIDKYDVVIIDTPG